MDEKRNETDVCLGCGTFQLNDKVRGLVEKLVGEMRVEVVQKKPIVVVEEKKKGVLYERRGVGGKWGWYRSGDENKDNGKYEGDVENGKPNGLGFLIYPDGWKYVGEWKDGEMSDQGTYTWTNGDKYVGEYKDGVKNGQGTYTWSDGKKYVGEWLDGETKRSWYCHVKGWDVCRRMEGE